jgi:serine/threonine-protein kinase SRPK3
MDSHIEIDSYIKNLLSKFDKTYIYNDETKKYNFINNNDSEYSDSEYSDSEYSSKSEESKNEESNNKDDSNYTSTKSSGSADKISGNEFRGTIIKDYMILDKIGCGAFSSVWLGYSIKNKNLVAIKICHPQDHKDGLKEINILENIRNKNIDMTYILTYIEHFEIDPIELRENYYKNDVLNKHIIIIMPLLGCTSYDLLDLKKYQHGLSLDILKEIMKQIILGLIELEAAGVMHTDLKPENILIEGITYKNKYILELIQYINIEKSIEEIVKKYNIDVNIIKTQITKTISEYIELKDMYDDECIMDECLDDIKIKICDFNCSIEYINRIGEKDIEIQTRYYRAPEIIIGYGLHKTTDVWSLGCLFYELLTGILLFDPRKDIMTTDQTHLYLIQELFGSFDRKMIINSNNREDLYDSNYKILHSKTKIKKIDMKDRLKEDLKLKIYSNNQIKYISKFIENILCIDCNLRSNYKQILNLLDKVH